MKRPSTTTKIFKLIHRNFEDFDVYNVRDASLIPSRDLAIVQRSGSISWFLVLVKHATQNKVALEFAWPHSGSFPTVSPRPCVSNPERGIEYLEFVVRLKDEKNRDRWWTISAEADDEYLEKIASEISAGINAGALPVLNEFANPRKVR